MFSKKDFSILLFDNFFLRVLAKTCMTILLVWGIYNNQKIESFSENIVNVVFNLVKQFAR